MFRILEENSPTRESSPTSLVPRYLPHQETRQCHKVLASTYDVNGTCTNWREQGQIQKFQKKWGRGAKLAISGGWGSAVKPSIVYKTLFKYFSYKICRRWEEGGGEEWRAGLLSPSPKSPLAESRVYSFHTAIKILILGHIYLFIYLFTYLLIYLFVCLFVYWFIYLSNCLLLL